MVNTDLDDEEQSALKQLCLEQKVADENLVSKKGTEKLIKRGMARMATFPAHYFIAGHTKPLRRYELTIRGETVADRLMIKENKHE